MDYQLYLGVIFSLAGGAVFSLALVLVLFHTHLEKTIMNDQYLNIMGKPVHE